MKAVNLLPPADRPRAVPAAPENASKIVLGALGLLLLAMALFVFTKNQVTDRKDSIAQAQQEKAEADQRSQGLKAYGDFSKIKQTRVTSISELATKRFDWERLMRELALVLPPKVWVTQVDGKTAGAGAAAAASGGSSTTPAPAPTTGSTSGAATDTSSGSTSMTITGCAPSQKGVAETMVRLRSLAGAEEVDLKSSQAAADDTATGSADAAGGAAGCGNYVQFNGQVTFAAETPKDAGGKRVPSRLGGGA